jgi:subtilisin family serine protease
VGIRKNPNLNFFHASKGLGNDGSGYSSTIMAAVQGTMDRFGDGINFWIIALTEVAHDNAVHFMCRVGCVDSGARVISMSLGGPSETATERNFYQEIYDEGILIVAAAGNTVSLMLS